jgi:hypothetical protein
VHTTAPRTGSCARFQIRWTENPLATRYQLEPLCHAAIEIKRTKICVRSRGSGRRRFRFSHCIKESRRNEPNLVDLTLKIRDLGIGLGEVAIRLTKDGPLVAMDCIGMLKNDRYCFRWGKRACHQYGLV